MEIMEFEKVCFSCHRVMSIHTRSNYKECLEDLSERLQNIEKATKSIQGVTDIMKFAINQLEKKK